MNRIRAASSDTDIRADWSRDISSALARAMKSQNAVTSHQKRMPKRRGPGRPASSLACGISGMSGPGGALHRLGSFNLVRVAAHVTSRLGFSPRI